MQPPYPIFSSVIKLNEYSPALTQGLPKDWNLSPKKNRIRKSLKTVRSAISANVAIKNRVVNENRPSLPSVTTAMSAISAISRDSYSAYFYIVPPWNPSHALKMITTS